MFGKPTLKRARVGQPQWIMLAGQEQTNQGSTPGGMFVAKFLRLIQDLTTNLVRLHSTALIVVRRDAFLTVTLETFVESLDGAHGNAKVACDYRRVLITLPTPKKSPCGSRSKVQLAYKTSMR
jgi:hypothetical protein